MFVCVTSGGRGKNQVTDGAMTELAVCMPTWQSSPQGACTNPAHRLDPDYFHHMAFTLIALQENQCYCSCLLLLFCKTASFPLHPTAGFVYHASVVRDPTEYRKL